jgi:hypothetical protein
MPKRHTPRLPLPRGEPNTEACRTHVFNVACAKRPCSAGCRISCRIIRVVFNRAPGCRRAWSYGTLPAAYRGFLGLLSAARGTPTSSRVSSRGCCQHQPRSPRKDVSCGHILATPCYALEGRISLVVGTAHRASPGRGSKATAERPGPLQRCYTHWTPWDARGDSLQALHPLRRLTKK